MNETFLKLIVVPGLALQLFLLSLKQTYKCNYYKQLRVKEKQNN